MKQKYKHLLIIAVTILIVSFILFVTDIYLEDSEESDKVYSGVINPFNVNLTGYEVLRSGGIYSTDNPQPRDLIINIIK